MPALSSLGPIPWLQGMTEQKQQTRAWDQLTPWFIPTGRNLSMRSNCRELESQGLMLLSKDTWTVFTTRYPSSSTLPPTLSPSQMTQHKLSFNILNPILLEFLSSFLPYSGDLNPQVKTILVEGNMFTQTDTSPYFPWVTKGTKFLSPSLFRNKLIYLRIVELKGTPAPSTSTVNAHAHVWNFSSPKPNHYFLPCMKRIRFKKQILCSMISGMKVLTARKLTCTWELKSDIFITFHISLKRHATS